jgi:hypothetical protein
MGSGAGPSGANGDSAYQHIGVTTTSGPQMIDAYDYMDNQNQRLSDDFDSPHGSDHMMSPPLEPLDSYDSQTNQNPSRY